MLELQSINAFDFTFKRFYFTRLNIFNRKIHFFNTFFSQGLIQLWKSIVFALDNTASCHVAYLSYFCFRFYILYSGGVKQILWPLILLYFFPILLIPIWVTLQFYIVSGILHTFIHENISTMNEIRNIEYHTLNFASAQCCKR